MLPYNHPYERHKLCILGRTGKILSLGCFVPSRGMTRGTKIALILNNLICLQKSTLKTTTIKILFSYLQHEGSWPWLLKLMIVHFQPTLRIYIHTYIHTHIHTYINTTGNEKTKQTNPVVHIFILYHYLRH